MANLASILINCNRCPLILKGFGLRVECGFKTRTQLYEVLVRLPMKCLSIWWSNRILNMDFF